MRRSSGMTLHTLVQSGSFVSGWTGQRLLGMVVYAFDLTAFIYHGLVAGITAPRRSPGATRRPMMTQIIFGGVDAVPAVLLLGLTIGVAITSQVLPVAEAFSTQSETVNFVVDTVGIHLSSMMTAIIIVSRSGSAMAVDMGTMQQGGEIESLQLLGVDVADFFVAPRLIGTAVSQLILAVYFAGLSLFGGLLISGLLISSHYLDYFVPLLGAFDLQRTLLFVLMNLVFGLIIAGTACFHALKVTRSPTEIPQQTQRAIMNSLIMIFLVQSALVVVEL